MFELKVESTFSAAHHLLNYEGDCENQHGHNWRVEAYVTGNVLNESNLLIDFKVLKKELNKVLDILDHTDINQLKEFENISPSSEAIARFIYKELQKTIPQISKVSVWETATSCASYFKAFNSIR